MSELVYLTNPRDIEEQAAAWIARIDAGLDDVQKRALQQWFAAHPSHPEALARMATLWDDMAILDELATLFPLPRAKARARNLRWTWRIAAAAAVAALIAAAALFSPRILQRAGPTQELAANHYQGHYETGIGKQATATLPDGSTLTLNTNSSVDVVYSATVRRIVMNRGECLFQVMEDPSRPFDVHAAGHIVQAVGTAFDVRLKAQQVEVTVTKGVVKVLFAPQSAKAQASASGTSPPNTMEAMLSVGETAAFTPHQFSMENFRTLDQHDMEMQLSWKQGMLVFENEPLSEVLAEVSRYTPISLIAGTDVRNVKVGGYFKAGDINGLLFALKKNFGIDAEKTSANRIVLTRQ